MDDQQLRAREVPERDHGVDLVLDGRIDRELADPLAQQCVGGGRQPARGRLGVSERELDEAQRTAMMRDEGLVAQALGDREAAERVAARRGGAAHPRIEQLADDEARGVLLLAGGLRTEPARLLGELERTPPVPCAPFEVGEVEDDLARTRRLLPGGMEGVERPVQDDAGLTQRVRVHERLGQRDRRRRLAERRGQEALDRDGPARLRRDAPAAQHRHVADLCERGREQRLIAGELGEVGRRARVGGAALEVTADPLDDTEPQVRDGAQAVVVGGLVDRAQAQRRGEREVGLLGWDPGEQRERFRAHGSRLQDLDRLGQQDPRVRGIARGGIGLGRRDRAAPARVRIPRGRQPRGGLCQAPRGRRRAARGRHGRDARELRRDRRVRDLHRQREMQRMGLLAGVARRQARVDLPPALGPHVGVDARREQRMREHQRRAVLPQHALRDRRVDRALEPLLRGDPPDRVGAPVEERRHDDEQLADALRQRLQALMHELLEARGHGQGLVGRLPGAATLQGTCDLQRVEGIAARALVQAPQHRPGRRHPELLGEQPVQLVEIQRPQREALHHVRLRHAGQPERQLGLLGAAPRDEQADGLVAEAAGRVLEHRRRRRVEPLRVIDGDGHRRLRGERAQHAEERTGQRARVGRRAVGLLQQQRNLQCAPSRAGQRGQRLVQHTLQQVRQSGERQRHLGGGRGAAQHPAAGGVRERHALVPERGLADARLALEDECRGVAAERGERRERRPLPVASDHGCRAVPHMPSIPSRVDTRARVAVGSSLTGRSQACCAK